MKSITRRWLYLAGLSALVVPGLFGASISRADLRRSTLSKIWDNRTSRSCVLPGPSAPFDALSSNVRSVLDSGECGGADQANLDEARAEYQSLLDPQMPVKTAQIPGGSQPSMALTGPEHDLHIGMMILGLHPPANWPAVAEGCETLVCGLGKLYGGEEGALRALNIAKRTGYVMSAASQVDHPGQRSVAVEPTQTWSVGEIRNVDRALSRLPDNFKRMSSMKRFFRAQDGWRYPGSPNTIGMAYSGDPQDPGRIVLYEGAFRGNGDPEETIIHEVGHQFDFSALSRDGRDFSDSSGFSALSLWGVRLEQATDANGNPVVDASGNPRMARVWGSDPDANFVSSYSKTSPREDFAESVSHYVREPELMKVLAPDKYDLIKTTVFNGREYGGAEPWPMASDAILAMGGVKSVIEGCTGLISQVAGTGDRFTLREQIGNGWTDMPLGDLSYYFQWTKCLDDKVDRLAAAVATDPEYCKHGGKAGVEKYLQKKVKGPILRILQALRTQTGSGSGVDACLQARDLTRDCRIQAIATEIGTSVPGSEAGTQALLNRFVPERIPARSVPGLVASQGKLSLSLSCLSGFSAIQVVEGFAARFQYQLPGSSESASSSGIPTESAGCQEGLRAALEAKGYRVPQDRRAFSGMGGSPGLGAMTDSFETQVLWRWPDVIAACPDEPSQACRRAAVQRVLERWVVSSGGQVIDLPPDFAAQLMLKVQFQAAPRPSPSPPPPSIPSSIPVPVPVPSSSGGP